MKPNKRKVRKLRETIKKLFETTIGDVPTKKFLKECDDWLKELLK